MRSILTTILFMAFSALCAGPAHATRQPDRPNIIFILADDLGYADVGCYGATKIKTPHIDRIAKEGILFTDGHAGASTCTPTRYGFMTGRAVCHSILDFSARVVDTVVARLAATPHGGGFKSWLWRTAVSLRF
jgi:hypothetical protein